MAQTIPAKHRGRGKMLSTRAPPPWLGSAFCGGLSAACFVAAATADVAVGVTALSSMVGIASAMAAVLLLPAISAPSKRWQAELPSGKVQFVIGLDGILCGDTFVPFADVDSVRRVSRSDRARKVVRLDLRDGGSVAFRVEGRRGAFVDALEERLTLHHTLRKPRFVRHSDGYRAVRVTEEVPDLVDAVLDAEWAEEDVAASLADALVGS